MCGVSEVKVDWKLIWLLPRVSQVENSTKDFLEEIKSFVKVHEWSFRLENPINYDILLCQVWPWARPCS